MKLQAQKKLLMEQALEIAELKKNIAKNMAKNKQQQKMQKLLQNRYLKCKKYCKISTFADKYIESDIKYEPIKPMSSWEDKKKSSENEKIRNSSVEDNNKSSELESDSIKIN